MTILRAWFAIPLWKRVLGALALGLIFVLVWPEATPAVALIGDLFVRAMRMLVAPIVLVAIAAGITSLADPKRLGSLGGRTIALFASATGVAVSVAMAVATFIRPSALQILFVHTSLPRLVAKLPLLPFFRAAPAVDDESMART